MPTTLLEITPGFGREATRKADPLGPLVAELQDHVEVLLDTVLDNLDVATNSAAIATLQTEVEQATTGLLDRTTDLESRATALETDVATLQTEVETASTGLLDRATALETDVATLQTEVETATTGLLDRVTAVEAAQTTDETHITQIQGSFHDLVPISFETGETGIIKVFFHKKVTINKVRFFTTRALADTDAGTITLKNSAGSAMANGALSIPASSAWGYEPTAVSPTTNNVVTADSFIEVVTAKTTAGGLGFCTIEYTITP